MLATKILPGYHSDHSLVLLNLDINTPRKGRGFWKLNTSLLSDPNYVSRIQNSIVQTKEDNIGADPDLLWDIIKCNIRRDTISYTFHKKKLTPHNLDLLENNLEKLTQQQMDGTGIPNIEQQIEQCKKQIDDIITLETQGSALRAKTQYYEDGEKGSKYFHDLENRNYTNQTICRLQTTTGIITSDTQDILAEGETFFSQLYESKIDKTLEDNSENWDKFFPNKSVSNDKELINKLDTLELPLTESELWKAIRESSINKNPGSDGFPIEFYVTFWKDVKDDLMSCFNECFAKGKLSITQRQGIISLIPKSNKNPLLLSNWRPLSLVNSDYKILTKCLAGRIKPLLADLINPDQCGFIPGRHIGDNILNVDSISEYLKSQDKSGIGLCLDFEKAFDSVEWSAIMRALRNRGFGPNFIKWIETIQSNPVSCFLNNGHYSKFFQISRGV